MGLTAVAVGRSVNIDEMIADEAWNFGLRTQQSEASNKRDC